MHIVHIYKDYPPIVGGIEGHLQVLAEGVVAHGHQATVLVTNPKRGTTDTMENGVRVLRVAHELKVASTPFSLGMVIMARGLRADLVHLHMPYPPGDLVARAIGGNPPLVISYHSDVVRQKKLLRIYRPLLQHTLGRATQIVAASRPYIDSSPFLRPFADKCAVVPYGIAPARFGSIDAVRVATLREALSKPIILSVGVLRYYKGLHILLDALPEVEGTLVIVGAGPEEAKLRAQVAALGLQRRVVFAGRVSDDALPTYYQAADLFVLPSHLRAEAFGIVLLEAMAAGLPLVTTELGTATSVINQNNVTGLVVPPGDAWALARAINVLGADPALRAQFGAAARVAVEQEYTKERMVNRMLDVYRHTLNRPGRAA